LVSSGLLVHDSWLSVRERDTPRKLLGENDVEAVLRRLDGLWRNRAPTTEVVYGLFNKMKLDMNGMENLFDIV